MPGGTQSPGPGRLRSHALSPWHPDPTPPPPKSPAVSPGRRRPPTQINWGSGARQAPAEAPDRSQPPASATPTPRSAHPLGAPRPRGPPRRSQTRGCGSGRAGRHRAPARARPSLLPGPPTSRGGAARRREPPQGRCRDGTCALVPGRFRLSTAVPSAMTIVPESGRLESVPGCGDAACAGRGRAAPGGREPGRGGAWRNSASARGRAGGRGGAPEGPAGGGRGWKEGTADGCPAAGGGGKKEQPTAARLQRGKERPGGGGPTAVGGSPPAYVHDFSRTELAPWRPSR